MASFSRVTMIRGITLALFTFQFSLEGGIVVTLYYSHTIVLLIHTRWRLSHIASTLRMCTMPSIILFKSVPHGACQSKCNSLVHHVISHQPNGYMYITNIVHAYSTTFPIMDCLLIWCDSTVLS